MSITELFFISNYFSTFHLSSEIEERINQAGKDYYVSNIQQRQSANGNIYDYQHGT